MLVVDTYLKEFKGKGIGLVSNQHIKKGQKVWVYNPIIDINIDKNKIPKEAKNFFEKYGVELKSGSLILNTDDARFINHSKKPNLKNISPLESNIALRDISPGEELTIDYSTFDINEINFEILD